jgi:signal transduction histidine kinase
MGAYAGVEGTLLPQDRGILGRVVRTRQPQQVLDVRTDPDYIPRLPDVRAQMTLPLIARERFIGVLILETAHPHRFETDTFEFIQLLAGRIAGALDNAFAYESMKQLAADLDSFSQTVAHDLQNPLGLVMGYAGYLKSDLPVLPQAEILEHLNQIELGAHKMRSIIQELLFLSRAQTPGEIQRSSLDMGAIVRGALGGLALLAQDRKAEFEVQEDWPAAVGYAPWIEEVWANYISNAIKYGGTPPCVSLGATVQADGTIRFWVRDNGPGLPPEHRAAAFDRYTRFDANRAEGHGLGLSIVKRIIEKLNGLVGVDDAPGGTGCEFYFTLPPAGQVIDWPTPRQ